MSKKIIVLFLFWTVIYFPVRAQSWMWAKSVTQNSKLASSAENIALDSSGNIFITGRFNADSLTFGSITILNNGIGYVDSYIAKYDPSGIAIWAKAIGGQYFEESTQVATDLSGNSYVTGCFDQNFIMGNDTLVCGGLMDIFFIKFDGAGNVLWARSAGSLNFDRGYGIATDAAGNAYLTGDFCSDSITFGSTTLFNTSTGGYADAFITKYDPNGNVIWAKKAGGTANDRSNSITVAQSGDLFITGSYDSPSLSFNNTTLINNGFWDVFLAKYDSSGNVLWAKSAGGTLDDESNCISTDNYGNAYITGDFSSVACSFDNLTLNSAGLSDFFLTKYDSMGNALWAKRAGGNSMDFGNSVTVNTGGYIYVTGTFISAQIIIGSDTLITPVPNHPPMFIARYDQNGNTSCTSVLSSAGNFGSNGVVTDASGNAFVTGTFNVNPFIVGPDTLFTSVQVPTVQGDIFIAKYSCDHHPKGIAESDENEKIVIYPNPGNGLFQVTIPGFHNGQNTLEVYDSYGKLIAVNEIQNSTAQVDISSHCAGLYFIRFVAMDEIFTAKIIKQ